MGARDLTFDEAMEIGDRIGLTSVETEALWRVTKAVELDFDEQVARVMRTCAESAESARESMLRLVEFATAIDAVGLMRRHDMLKARQNRSTGPPTPRLDGRRRRG